MDKHICPHCGKDVGDYLHSCEHCGEEFGPRWPVGGEACELCGEKIDYLYTKDWESHYECSGCGRE